MSEEPTGSDFTLANAGLTPAPTEPEFAEPATYGAGIEGVREAANDLSRERKPPDSDEPVERFLEWKTGSKAGQRVDLQAERMSLTAEQAARTLSQVHRAEETAEAVENLSALQADVDATRAQLAGQQQPDAQQQPAQAETPQPDAPQAESAEQPSTGIDPDFAALLEKKPQLRAQLEAPFQQAEAARQAFAGATAQVAGMLVAELAADLPEIVNLPPDQRMVGLQILRQQQPERYAAVEARAGRIQQVVNAQQQNNAFVAQQQQKQFKQWAAAQDKVLESKVPEIANDADMKVSRAALKSLRDAGFTDTELAAGWHGEAALSLRDHRAQLLIWKASKYDEAMANAHTNPASRGNIPPVQRPGTASSAGERAYVDVSELRNEFKRATGNEQLRLAAKLQQAQRRARG